MSHELGSSIPTGEAYEDRNLQAGVAGTMGSVAISGADRQAAPVDMHPMGLAAIAAQQQAEAAKQKETAETARIETLKILDKDALKLGDLNPLIHSVNLARQESVNAVRYITLQKIHETGGLVPKVLESTVVFDPTSGKSAPRFIARFEVADFTEQQLSMLERLVKETYGESAATRKNSKGDDIEIQDYPPTQLGEEMKSKTGGWYMGLEAPKPLTSLHQGLFVFRDLGQINKGNFLASKEAPGGYIIEVREANKEQTDLVTFVTQIASILGQEKTLDTGKLLYEIYYDLLRPALKKPENESIYGMEHAINKIKRELVIPLANPDISKSIGQDPQSVLMVGVPGTGKTLVTEGLLQEETGLFIVPIDPFELQREIAKPKDAQYLLPRIRKIAQITGRPVIVHIDDIENMVSENETTNSTMLNLMAGVQESGFYLMASANVPQKISPALIQPQRFSVLIHCGLQDEKARYEILKIHANRESKHRKMPLFSSDEERDYILGKVAASTEAFTPRYLANIATVAKSFLVERVARTTGKITGLTEEDLDGHTYCRDDWERAYAEVFAKYDSAGMKRDDEVLRRFVEKHDTARSSSMGYGSPEVTPKSIFPPDPRPRLVAAEAAERNKA